jgi:hypothetical protein
MDAVATAGFVAFSQRLRWSMAPNAIVTQKKSQSGYYMFNSRFALLPAMAAMVVASNASTAAM